MNKLFKIAWNIINNERGGGSEPQFVQAPQQPPAPSASETAADIYKAKLEYDPQMAALEMQQQQTYLPQQAALYQSLYNQYYPQMAMQQQQLQQQLYPTQSRLLEAGAGRALERLQSPNYMTPEEQAALQSDRERQVTGLQESMRTRANLGGGLYGGRTASAEARNVGELINQFGIQDYTNRMNAGQAAQQNLIPYMQILYPQVGAQQPNISPFQYQSAVPGADQLYNAMYGASRNEYGFQPGSPSPMWGLAGNVLGGIAGGWANNFF